MKTKDVEKYFGTRYRIAKVLGCNSQAVYQWGKVVPELSARRLEVITKGELKVDESLYVKGAA